MLKHPLQDFFSDILERDKYYYLLEPSSIDFYLSEAVKCGSQLAEEFYGLDLELELSKRNIILIYSDADTIYHGLTIYGRTINTRRGIRVEIFNKAIKEKLIQLSRDGKQADEKLLFKVYLAHEFYHAVSYYEGISVSDFLPPVYKKILVIRKRISIKALEEIAAHAFSYYYCSHLNSLPDFDREAIHALYL